MKFRLKSLAVCCLFAVCISCSNNSNPGDLRLIPVKSGEKWGYVGKKGEYVINPQFADAEFFQDGLAKIVSFDGKVGFIDEDGKYIIVARFKSATAFSNGLAFTVSDGGYPVCIDRQGEIKFALKQAKYAFSFSEGLAAFANTDNKFGYVDKSGAMVINPQFEDARPFSEGLAAVRQKEQWGFIDKTGRIVINPQFAGVGDFKNGVAVFSNGKLSGYIDAKGAYKINPQFEFADLFNEGLARVKIGREFGYINETGKFEINPQFDNAYPFNSGLAVITQGARYGFINRQGKIEINPQFDNASQFYNDMAFVCSADKWGIIDKKGKYLVNPQFDAIRVNAQYSYIVSDYYDVTDFVGKFLERVKDNSFDGFTITSTLQNIVDNATYGNNINYNEYAVYCPNKQEITADISIDKTSFHFGNPVYENVSTYENVYGYRYSTGSKRQYKYSEKIAVIEYRFNLSGGAGSKGGAIASALKTEIENRYNVKMESQNGKYFTYQDGKISFIVAYNDYSLALYVGFDKDKLQNLTINF